MGYTKGQYENLINGANFFLIDRTKDSELWKTEARKLLVLTIEYYKECVLRRETFENYGVELFESIKQGIRSFSPDKGVFLHYVNVAIKRRIRQKKLSDALDRQRRGLSVSEKDNQLIKKMLAYVRSKGYDISDPKTQDRIAGQFHLSIEQVRICVEQSQIRVIDETVSNSKGESSSVFDGIASNRPNAEEMIEENEKQLEIIRRVDAVFQICQERQKPLLSYLLTARLIPEMDLNEYVLEELETISFIDKQLLKEFIASGKMPPARQIATEFGLTEQSVSRTLKVFFEKVPRKC